MLPRDELFDAVEIQKRSYQLLRWLGDAIDQGVIGFTREHDCDSAADAALEWIEEHYHNIPPLVRPEPDQLRPFSNYFGSYVTTSFDLVEEPGQRWGNDEDGAGCRCELCVQLIKISHLRPKKPSKRDKQEARNACVRRVEQLAVEEGVTLNSDQAADITDMQLRNAAYSAYGSTLIERTRGEEGGIYILALWRMIAWTPQGSPIKDFSLEAEDIINAEHELVATMVKTS